MELVFIKTIKTAAGNPAKINCSRPQPTYGNTLPDQSFKHLQRSVRLIKVSVRKAGDKTGCFYVFFHTYLYRAVIQCGTLASFGKKHFFHKGIVHGSKNHFTLVFYPD